MKTFNTIKQRLIGRKQRGFTLIELTVVFLITVILAVLAVPRVQALIIENRTPSLANDLNSAATRIRGSRAGSGGAPYAGIDNTQLVGIVKNSNFVTSGTNLVYHNLTAGAVTAATVTLAAAAGGEAFSLAFAGVDRAACQPLVTALSGQAERIAIGATVVKDTTLATPAPYNAGTATTGCNVDTAAITFQFR